MISLIIASAFADPPKITISKETTYITGPLRADGMLDYAAGYNAYFKDVKPEENAAVELAKAIGPKVAPQKFAKEYFQLLGMAPPDEDGRRLQDVVSFVKQRGDRWTEELSEQYEKCLEGPWSRKRKPIFDVLLKRNAEAMDFFVKASHKPKLFVPCFIDKEPATLWDWDITLAQDSRTGVRHLLLRAMTRVEDGDADGAIEDLEACYRLSSLFCSGRRFLIEGLIGIAIRGVALRAERAIAFSGRLSHENVDRRMKRISSMTAPVDVASSLDVSERLGIISATHFALLGDPEAAFGGKDPMIGRAMKLMSRYDLDGDEVLRTINRYYDRLVAAARISNANMDSPLGVVLEDLEKWKKEWEKDSGWLLAFVGTESHPKGRRGALGKRWGEMILLLTTPAAGSVVAANIKSKANERLTILAYRLTQYKKKRGSYPEKLDAKELNVPGDVLIDPFADKPFAYRTKNGKREIVSYWLDRMEKKKPNAVRRSTDSILELP